MQRWLVVSSILVMLAGCYATPPRGARTPYPPGPLDMANILIRNDYSRLCPDHYEYCRAGKRSICCPSGACCDDGTGPYCCDSRGYDDRRWEERDDDRRFDERSADRPPPPPAGGGPCGAQATTCSRGGVTICCSEDEGCCSDAQGLYCCSSRRGGY